jgi:hypothetical protein
MIVLYMLRRIEFSMTTAQISEFVQGKGYTDYFTLVTSLSELEEAGLIHAETILSSAETIRDLSGTIIKLIEK